MSDYSRAKEPRDPDNPAPLHTRVTANWKIPSGLPSTLMYEFQMLLDDVIQPKRMTIETVAGKEYIHPDILRKRVENADKGVQFYMMIGAHRYSVVRVDR